MRKYATIVNDRERKFIFRGPGTETECRGDVKVLVEKTGIPPRKIEIVPVVGPERRKEDNLSMVTSGLISLGFGTIVVGLGFLLYKKIIKKKKEE